MCLGVCMSNVCMLISVGVYIEHQAVTAKILYEVLSVGAVYPNSNKVEQTS